jgi:phi13 family phage major tail protein
MAKIGLKYMVYNNGINKGVVGKAIKADITIQSNNVELYANDALCETDKSFQSGSITLGTDELADALHTDLLGHSVDGGGEITANGNDLAPYNSIGFYCVKKVNGVRKFRAIWLLKVQFAEPNDSNQTKNNSPAFSTPEIVGTIMLDDNGNWKNEKTFDLEADAIAYLN